MQGNKWKHVLCRRDIVFLIILALIIYLGSVKFFGSLEIISHLPFEGAQYITSFLAVFVFFVLWVIIRKSCKLESIDLPGRLLISLEVAALLILVPAIYVLIKLWPLKITYIKMILIFLILILSASVLTCWVALRALGDMMW